MRAPAAHLRAAPATSTLARGMLVRRAVLVRPRAFVPVSLVLAALAAAPTARADDDLERARALFDEAGELEKQGQWGAAQERLRAAIRIRETPHLRYALGWALENGGKLIDARTEYELAQRLAQRAGIEEVASLSATRIAEVDRKTPLLQLRVRGQLAPGTRVAVDGRPVALRDDSGTVPVDPGTRVVRIERPGRAPSEHSVSVSAGMLRVVDLTGDDVSVRDDGEPGRSRSPLPWVLVGGGAALAATSVALFIASGSDVDERDDSMRRWCDATACANGTTATLPETEEAAAFRRQAYDAADSGNTKQIIGAVAGGIGVVGIAVGAYLLLSRRSETSEASAAGVRVRVEARPLAGGAFGGATLSF